jgi:O-succinylbenzoic acid--CoA ligase
VTPGYYGTTGTDAFCAHGLRTGDAGYRTDAGALVVCNRIDDRIHSGGETIDPGEVIEVLRTIDGVSDAAVVGLADDEWGEQVAALVASDRDSLTVDEIESACREQLAGYKIPRTLTLTDCLPRTESGTIKRDDVTHELQAARDDAGERTSLSQPDESQPSDDVDNDSNAPVAADAQSAPSDVSAAIDETDTDTVESDTDTAETDDSDAIDDE